MYQYKIEQKNYLFFGQLYTSLEYAKKCKLHIYTNIRLVVK